MSYTNWDAYEETLRAGNFIKLCRLRFLNPDGSTAFALDNDPYNQRSGAFIAAGQLNVNLQNGTRRTAEITVENVDGAFDYNYNKVWFGTEVALDMGVVLPDGTESHYRFLLPKKVPLQQSLRADFRQHRQKAPSAFSYCERYLRKNHRETFRQSL